MFGWRWTWVLFAFLSAPAFAGDQLPEKVIWPKSGPARSSEFQIVVVGDGWKADQMGEYAEFCDKLVDGLFAIKPYNQLSPFFTVIRVDAISEDEGCLRKWVVAGKTAPPEWPATRNTKLKISYDITSIMTEKGARGEPLYYGSPNLGEGPTGGSGLAALAAMSTKQRIDSLLSRQPSRKIEVVVVITNDKDIKTGIADAGAPEPNGHNYLIVSRYDVQKSTPAAILAHELGHAMFYLGDEYENPPNCRRPLGDHANIEVNKDPKTCKWRHLTKFLKGPFQGAYYCSTGKYRPEQACKMRDEGADRFCMVCLERMIQRVDEQPWLIESEDPPADSRRTYKLTRFGGGVEFKVKCRGGAEDSSIKGVWTLDGSLISKGDGATVSFSPTGPTFKMDPSHARLFLMTGGTHKLKFMTSARLIDSQDAVPTSPRNSREWNLYISSEIFPYPSFDNFWEDK